MIPHGSTIGILGGGQLGRMLAIAAAELGYHAHIYSPEADAPAKAVALHHTEGAYEDAEALARFAASVDVVTFEFENIPVTAVTALAASCPVHPSAAVLRTCQHRILEKEFIRSLGIETAPFKPVYSAEDLRSAVAWIGLPAILKTAELGYDGKGQIKLEAGVDLDAAWAQLNTKEAVLEGFVLFEREISVLICRSASGESAAYAPVENIHRHHILHQTIAPAPISPRIAAEAEGIAAAIAGALELVGILAVEMFVEKDGTLRVNELAPRPHNSGHWTLDASVTSQFEQTVRAICGLPLGSAEALCGAVMTNIIGDEINEWRDRAGGKFTKLHLYGKKEARPGRKMGHVTVLNPPPAPPASGRGEA